MKKNIILLLYVFVALYLCACDSNKVQEPLISTEDMLIADTKEDSPSNSFIFENLQESLKEKNEYATLTSTETVKSLTNDNSFKTTLTVTAETKYAILYYEVQLSYTKYDQGWMVDEILWSDEEYDLVRLPNQDTITSMANEVLANNNEYNGLFPIEGSIFFDEEYTEAYYLESERVAYEWEQPVQLLHGDYTSIYRSYWQYSIQSDSWYLLEDGDYGISFTAASIHRYDVDFSGSWEFARIESFSWSEITMSWYDDWDEEWSETVTFTQAEDHPSYTVYYSSNGFCLKIYLYEDMTYFMVWNGNKLCGGQTFNEPSA